jgi:hypothetical protein
MNLGSGSSASRHQNRLTPDQIGSGSTRPVLRPCYAVLSENRLIPAAERVQTLGRASSHLPGGVNQRLADRQQARKLLETIRL